MREDISDERDDGQQWQRLICDAEGCSSSAEALLGEEPIGWARDESATIAATNTVLDYCPQHAGLAA